MLRHLGKACDGVVAVETALVAGFILVPLLLGLWDLGQVALGKAQLEEALQDTITYVAAGNSGNASGITSAAQAAYGTSISVSTSTACYCVLTNSSTPTAPTSAACGSTCSNSGDLEQFMNITVTKTVTIPVPVPYFGSSVTLSSSGQVRTG